MYLGEGVEEAELTFHTAFSGQLIVKQSKDKLYHMDLPAYPPTDLVLDELDKKRGFLEVAAAPFQAVCHYCLWLVGFHSA